MKGVVTEQRRSDLYQWVDKYEEYLIHRLRRAKNTAMAYCHDIYQYLDFAIAQGLNPLHLATLDRWVIHLERHAKLEGSSINRKVVSVRNFGEFLVYEQCLDKNPFQYARRVRVEEKLPVVFSVEATMEIINSIDRTTDEGIRDYAMAALFYGTSIRLSTLHGLNLEHVQLGGVSGDELIIPAELVKNNQEKRIPLLPFVSQAIKMYLPVRNKYAPPYERALFVSRQGRRVSISLIKKQMTRHIRRVVEKGSIHTFRHSCLTHLHDMGVDLRYLQELAGHRSIVTTQRYTHVSTVALRKQLSQHPLQQLFTKAGGAVTHGA